MRHNPISRARLMTWVAPVVLLLIIAVVGVVKSNAMHHVRPADADIETPVPRLRTGMADAGKDETASQIPGAPAVDGPARSMALVIGNGRYPDGEASSWHPVEDARAMADELRARDFAVTFKENLSKQGMRDGFSSFAAKAEPGATALIFFSGYGIQSGRQTYLIPANAEIWREEDVQRDGLPLDPVLLDLDAHGVATKLVVIDASRRNPFERRFRGGSIGLAPISTPKGTLLIYSAAPNQVVPDSGAGMFVGELIAQMRRDGASLEEAFNRTRTMVARASRNEQVPGVFSSLTEDLSASPAPGTLAR